VKIKSHEKGTGQKNGLGPRVFVGLSGGVDSSVSAALLKQAGYEVTGVFIKVWQPDFLECTWIDDRRDAMRVAAKLNIPFMTLDLEDEYKKGVVDYMISEYQAGRTPNPDAMCNKVIKFGAFFDKAMSMGAEYVATGHYARTLVNKCETRLLSGADKNKDQSYFLWTLQKDKLKNIIFPIGIYEKTYVRELAKKFDLGTAAKKDSQGLCFIGKLDMKDFLKRFIPEQAGDVLNESGDVIGRHDGVFYVTLGQRHGFTIIKKGVSDVPMYVVSKNIKNNTITVSEDPKSENPTRNIVIEEVNWINEPHEKEELLARSRYRQVLRKCHIEKKNGLCNVIFEEADIFPSGQSLVVYRGEECLGGGIIK
jgi:tRNA-uridine 2-sulfurtransferase